MPDQIPPEIVTEILLRAQVRTLQTCKCVSKQWRSIIDDPNFIKRHIDNSIKTNTNNILFLQEEDGNLYELDFDTFGSDGPIHFNNPPDLPRNCGFSLLGSCNGLLCLRYENSEDILLLNPSLNKKHWIPGFTPEYFQTRVHLDEYGNWVYGTGYGFGYDCVNDEYKVIRIVQKRGIVDVGCLKSEVVICHVKAGVTTNVFMPYFIRTTHKMGVYVSGGLHWIMGRYDNLSSHNLIVAFDLETHKFQELPQPNYVNNRFRMNIGVLGSWLCVFANHLKVGVDVWVMKEYGVKESWIKLFSIPHNVLSYDSVRPLGFSQKGSEILLELNEKRLVWYDLEKKRAEKVEIYGVQNEYFESFICLRSLVPLDANGGWDEEQPQPQPKGQEINEKQQQPKEQKKTRKKKKNDFLSTGFKLKF